MKSGLLLINKPAGMSSTRVGSQIKRILQIRKVGHVGTLDPFATGLLPLAIGRATAVVRYMDDYDKRYLVRCRLGRSTDSLDSTGTTTATKQLSEEDAKLLLANDAFTIREQINTMVGKITQIPPLHSAIKVAGKKLYEYAHRGEEAPEIPARQVYIYSAELLDYAFDPDGDSAAPIYLDIDIACSKGTYVRTFCADLGSKLALPAYAEQLSRTEVGPFKLMDAHSLEDITPDTELLKIESALQHFPMIEFSLSDVDRLLCGLTVSANTYISQIPENSESETKYLIYSAPGPAGICQLRLDENGACFFIVERMFSDRASYFTR